MKHSTRSAWTACVLSGSFLVLVGIGGWLYLAKNKSAPDVVAGERREISLVTLASDGEPTMSAARVEHPLHRQSEQSDPPREAFAGKRWFEAPATVVVRIAARIVHEGHPAEGVAVAAQAIVFDEQGDREPAMTVFTRAAQRFFSQAGLSSADGLAETVLTLPQEDFDAAVVGVAAFSPEFGSSYLEVDARSIREGEPIDLVIERGKSVQGRVEDRNGNPVSNALVYITTHSRRGAIPQPGLGAITDSRGDFRFAGLYDGNSPAQLSVSHPARVPDDLVGEERRERLRQARTERKPFRGTLDESTRVYDAGRVLFSR